MTTHTEPQAVDYRTHLAEGNAFVRRVKNEDWATYTADQFVTAIQQAISYDAVRLARQLANAGVERFPENQRLQGYARVLAPPVVRRVNKQASPGVQTSSTWIAEHADEYRGKWIAVTDGKLVGVGTTLKQLVDQHPQIVGNTDVIVTRVLTGL